MRVTRARILAGAAPAPTSPPALADPFASARIALSGVASVDYPTAMAVRPSDGSLWAARKGGAVCRLTGSSRDGSQAVATVSTGNEQALRGIDSLAVDTAGIVSPGSRQNLPTQPQPEANHNGGNVVLGDGGGAGDQHGAAGNGQDPNTNLGKILRTDPGTGSVQRWSTGVRNPWRFSFERATGDLWIGDVDQSSWEEVTGLPAGAPQGRHLGWRCFEGTHAFAAGCSPAGELCVLTPSAVHRVDLG